MGPNGSGKSTLAAVLAGNEKFTVTEGSATFLGRDLLEMPIIRPGGVDLKLTATTETPPMAAMLWVGRSGLSGRHDNPAPGA